MKKILIGILIFTIAATACQKETIPNKTIASKDSFAISAINYLKTEINRKDFSKLNLKSINLLKSDSITIAIEIYKKDTADHKIVFIGTKENKYSGNWLTIITYGKPDDGLLITETFDGNMKNEVRFINGKAVKLTRTVNGVTKVISPVTAESLSLNSKQ